MNSMIAGTILGEIFVRSRLAAADTTTSYVNGAA